jgi:hypothetical protein
VGTLNGSLSHRISRVRLQNWMLEPATAGSGESGK